MDPSGLFTLVEMIQSLQANVQEQASTLQSYRITIKKTGCVLIEWVVEEAITKGIYFLINSSGIPYVGRSVKIPRRIREHARDTTRDLGKLMAVFKTNASTGQLRVLEQFLIEQLSDLDNVENLGNRRNEIAERPRSERSKKLRKIVKELEFCK